MKKTGCGQQTSLSGGPSAQKKALLCGSVFVLCAVLMACAYSGGISFEGMEEAVGFCMRYVGVK